MSYLTEQKTTLAQAQVAEALLRMKKLNLLNDVISYFKKEGKLYKSENFFVGDRSKRVPILYFLDEAEEKMVKEWEEKTGNVVYHVIKNHMEFGTCYSFLYVSSDTEDWEYDNQDLADGCPIVYVKNVDDDFLSEGGRIGIKPMVGAILRTA